MKPSIDELRSFLKDSIRQQVDFSATGQHRRESPPPVEKPAADDALRIDLPRPNEWQGIGPIDLAAAIAGRASRRQFKPEPLTLDELAFLLWATQGVREVLAPGVVLRTVPSAGCRHALETYIGALRVASLEPGLYRYLPLEHQLVLEYADAALASRLGSAALGQRFIGKAAAVFCWTAIPYRTEWRYAEASHKVIAIDAGHVCQNLYLACEAIGAGTCAVAAYSQDAMDQLLKVDGRDEFAVYLAPVGKV